MQYRFYENHTALNKEILYVKVTPCLTQYLISYSENKNSRKTSLLHIAGIPVKNQITHISSSKQDSKVLTRKSVRVVLCKIRKPSRETMAVR